MILPKGLKITIGRKTYKDQIPDRMVMGSLRESVLKAIKTAEAKEKKLADAKPETKPENKK